MTVIIVIKGIAGSGKDTIANYLKANYNFRSASFAAPLKEGVKAMFGLDDTHLDHPLKEQLLPDIEKSPRQLMQLLGTEYGRNLVHKDLWLILAKKKIDAYLALGYNVCLTDCRFDNEAEMVKANGGTILRVERGEAGTKFLHPSEAGITGDMVDYSIQNNSTMDFLYKQVDFFMGLL
jgi:hypothetical protein